jgi:hypothetical protein
MKLRRRLLMLNQISLILILPGAAMVKWRNRVGISKGIMDRRSSHISDTNSDPSVSVDPPSSEPIFMVFVEDWVHEIV